MDLRRCCYVLLLSFCKEYMIANCFNICAYEDCNYKSWQTWTSCTGGNTCERFVAKRIRVFCCPGAVKNQTIERCLTYCNTTAPWREYRISNSSCQISPVTFPKVCGGTFYIHITIQTVHRISINKYQNDKIIRFVFKRKPVEFCHA